MFYTALTFLFLIIICIVIIVVNVYDYVFVKICFYIYKPQWTLTWCSYFYDKLCNVIVLWNISVRMLHCSLHNYVIYASYTLYSFIHSDYEGGTMLLWNNNISHCCTLHKHQNRMNTNTKWSASLKSVTVPNSIE